MLPYIAFARHFVIEMRKVTIYPGNGAKNKNQGEKKISDVTET